MAAAAKHREALLAASVRLFRQKGYAATGLAEILAESGAPKGSLYHYFPGGKAEIGAEAVALAGNTVALTLKELAAETDGPGELMARYLDLMAGWMAASDFRDGSPITTTLLETVPEHEAIRQAGAAAFDSWAGVLSESAVAAGIPLARAESLARFAISALEGALIQCRVAGNAAPLRLVAEELGALYAVAQTR